MKKIFLLIAGLLFIATSSFAQLANDGLSGSTGTASEVTAANEATDTTCFPLFVTAATGALAPKTNAGLAFNSNTGMLTATGFTGPLTGNISGNAATVTVADEATDTTSFLLFATAASGSLAPKTNSALAFNASTGAVTLGGTLALGANNLTMTGSIGATGSRVTKGWFTDAEFTNIPTVNGGTFLAALGTNIDSIAGLTFADKSIIQLTGAGASAVLTCSAANQLIGVNAANDALECKSSLNISEINLPSSDADPGTTAGQIRHDSTDTGSNSGGTAKWYDGAQVRSLVDTGTNYTIITKTEYIPIAYAEDGAAAPAAASVWADTRKARIRVFAADADDDVEIHWLVPNDYVGGIKFRVVGFVDNATAPANTETVIFNLAGCSVGDSDDGGCTLGTGVDATFTADATYAQHDRWSTAWSNEVTVTNITASESVMLKLFRDVDDTYGQGIGAAGLEIKYKAKVIGIAGY